MKVCSILISCDNNKYECNCIRGPFGQEYNYILNYVSFVGEPSSYASIESICSEFLFKSLGREGERCYSVELQFTNIGHT